MAVHKKFPALGRGLDALISTEEVRTQGSSSINEVEIGKIRANPNQPRREFDEQSLEELAESIKEIGLVQPITVRKMDDDTYTIVAGERRWRAGQMAGLTSIPAYIRTVDDENMMEMALVENIQRQDLNPMEIALAYQHLIEQYDLTQERLSEKVGKNRATVTNYLRLLKLPASIQVALEKREIDMGHARALLSLNNPTLQNQVFDQIKADNLSVRKVEQIVKELVVSGQENTGGKKTKGKRNNLSAQYAELKKELSNVFNAKVQLSCTDKGHGRISIAFTSEKDLVRIIEMLDQLRH
ncbi:MAG: ParB/RepB/Spo0J family partition protein [Prevotellaceae bacterium]|nr:ParB/RepB/Spo0J family partition protein [Prevotellaceae bacterium]